MLIESIRKHSSSWWFRTFLFLLAVTLGFLWYGQDILSGRQTGVSNLASVGGKKINMKQFADTLSQELGRLQNTLNESIPPEQQKKIYPYVLENMVNNLLLEREAERLKLIVTDNKIRDSIRTDENFLTAENTFDREKFNIFLKNINVREKDFIETLRKNFVRIELIQSLFSPLTIPQLLTHRLFSYENQRRIVEITTIESKLLKLEKEPSHSEIEDFFKKNPEKFLAPEYRDITALLINDSIINPQEIQVTEAEIQEAYKNRSQEFEGNPFTHIKENLKTEIQKKRISEKIYALTNQIDDAIAGGASLEEIAQTYHLKTQKFINVSREGTFKSGHNHETEIPASLTNEIDLRILQESFGENEGETSKLIEIGEEKYLLMRVDKIERARPLTYEESHNLSLNLLIQHLKSEKAKEMALEIEHLTNQGGLFSLMAQQKGFKVARIKIGRKGSLVPTSFYLPEHFIEALYHLPAKKGKAASYLNDQNQQDYIVGSVIEVEAVNLKGAEEKLKTFQDKLRQDVFNDLYHQYLNSLHVIFPVEYNDKALQRLIHQP